MTQFGQILADYHMHSTFSPDGNEPPEALCRQALALGLRTIAITEHAEWHSTFPPGLAAGADDYFRAIERCRAEFAPQGLTVLAGVELGNPHEHPAEAAALLAAYPFDLVLASVHWLDGLNIHEAPCFAGRLPTEVYADYFAALGQMAATVDFDVVAHFDRILLRGTALGGPFDPLPFETPIRQVLANLARRGIALEINARCLALTPGWNETLVTILGWFREAGGGQSVVFGSDAHRSQDIGRHREIAQRLLGAAGFGGPAQLVSRQGRVARHAAD
jgi:histidinol-phosphatase (PHP family)